MKRSLSLLLSSLLTLFLLHTVGWRAQAAISSIIDLSYGTPYPDEPGCFTSFLSIAYSGTFVTDDYNGSDYVASFIYDSNGALIVHDLTGIKPVDQPVFGFAHPPYSLNPIPPGNVQATLYDILPSTPFGPVNGGSWESWILANSVILDTAILAEPPGGWPQCGQLAPGGMPFDPQDGRLNPDPAAPAAFYAPVDGSLQVYGIDEQSHGYLAIYVSPEQLAALPPTPEQNLTIAQTSDGKIALYKLTTGEYQVNAGPDFEGKVFVYIFGGDPLALVSSYTNQTNEPSDNST